MRRADRLFQTIQLLRLRRVVTAKALAKELGVSERTVYRDIRDLVISGVPIEGEAGVGYLLRHGFDLPPLMFTEPEVEALVLGIRVVSSWGDESLGRAARDALGRVEAALPDRLRARLDATRMYVPAFQVSPATVARLGDLRAAIEAHRKVDFEYAAEDGGITSRTIRPVGLFFWGSAWTVAGWCELRDDFRSFRLDRILDATITAQTFEEEPGRTLADFIRRESGGDPGAMVRRPT